MTNPLRTLQEFGQSVWLDFVSRDLLKSGGLARLVAEDGIRGVTSNPSIFEKAIGHGDDYDEVIAAAERIGRSRSRCAVRGTRDPRHPGWRRRAEHGLRADAAPRRLHLDRGLALSCDADARDDRGGAASVAQHRPAQPDGEGAGDKAGPAGDPHADRRGHQRQRHAAVFAESLRGRRRGLYLRARGFRREGRRPAQGCQRRQLLRQPHRYAGRRGARQAHRRRRGPGRKAAACRAQGQGGDRQRQARLSALPAPLRRRALAAPRAEGGADAAPVVGQHRHQEPGLQRRALCRGADRPGHGQHDAAGDDGRVPRPWPAARQPRRGRRRRARRDGCAAGRRRFDRRHHGAARRGRRQTVRRRGRPALRGGAEEAPHRARQQAQLDVAQAAEGAGRRGQGGARRLAQRGQGSAALGRRRLAVDRDRRGQLARLADMSSISS